MKRMWVWIFCAWQTLGHAVLCADEPGRDQVTAARRLRDGFSFIGHLRDRSMTTLMSIRYYQGRTDFKDRQLLRKSPEREGAIHYTNVLSSRQESFHSSEVEPFPIVSDSILIKVMLANRRETNINYEKSTTSEGISSFVDRPLSGEAFRDFVANSSAGIWHGYLLFPEIPDFAEFVEKCDWDPPQEPHQVTGFYKNWRVRFSFDTDDHSRPIRFEVDQAAQGVGKDQPYASHSRVIEFSDWKDFDGLEAPGHLLVWDISNNHKGEVKTCTKKYTLEKVSPVMEVSNHLGDFFTDVSNGRPVQVDDYLGIDFIWQDGEIVRKVDGVKLASLIGQPFFGSPLRRYLLMGLGLCVLAGAGWFVWRRPVRPAPPSSAGRFQ